MLNVYPLSERVRDHFLAHGAPQDRPPVTAQATPAAAARQVASLERHLQPIAMLSTPAETPCFLYGVTATSHWPRVEVTRVDVLSAELIRLLWAAFNELQSVNESGAGDPADPPVECIELSDALSYLDFTLHVFLRREGIYAWCSEPSRLAQLGLDQAIFTPVATA